MYRQYEEALNASTETARLDALGSLMSLVRDGSVQPPESTQQVNNHIHTIYSFSPYSPTNAVYQAWKSGLRTAGIMDHDSMAGAEEFIRAGEIAGISTTVGFECRCRVEDTPLYGRRINNPDQSSIAYLAMHGIPHQHIGRAQEFLAPYRQRRNLRNQAMVENLNRLMPAAVRLDFERDVLGISENHAGGVVTERHLLYALSGRLMEEVGAGEPLLDFLRKELGITVSGTVAERLADAANPLYQYYLLNHLKSSLVEQFYVDAHEECPHITDFIQLADEIGAISAYAYLGDVGDSVTGDKKTQAFEDAWLDELVSWLAQAGFRAVTYMPTRNTLPQLRRVMRLCELHGLFQVSGEDINSPFQSFRCAALEQPEFAHLITATWALIGHEAAATRDQDDGMFSAKTQAALPDLGERTQHFYRIGQATLPGAV